MADDALTCRDCGHRHTPDGCAGEPTPSDRWAGVAPAACDCPGVADDALTAAVMWGTREKGNVTRRADRLDAEAWERLGRDRGREAVVVLTAAQYDALREHTAAREAEVWDEGAELAHGHVFTLAQVLTRNPYRAKGLDAEPAPDGGEDHPPCCSACQGAGGTAYGPCWDCRGTGHPHPLADTPLPLRAPDDVPRDRPPADYAEQRALLDDSLRDIPPYDPSQETP